MQCLIIMLQLLVKFGVSMLNTFLLLLVGGLKTNVQFKKTSPGTPNFFTCHFVRTIKMDLM